MDTSCSSKPSWAASDYSDINVFHVRLAEIKADKSRSSSASTPRIVLYYRARSEDDATERRFQAKRVGSSIYEWRHLFCLLSSTANIK